MPNNVDIVICTCNNRKIIEKVLNSVKKQSSKNYNCWLVDDCSEDNTVEFVRKKYPWVKCIETGQRNGPSRNRNIAIAEGKAPYIVTLDDDVELEPKWMEKMLAFMENNPKVGIAESRLVPALTDTDPEKYACTAAMIMRRAVIDNIGGFDEAYFYALEDTDFSLRAQRYGWVVETNNEAKALHRLNFTIKRLPNTFKRYTYWKNYIRTILKNNSKKRLAVQLPVLGARLSALFVKDIVTLRNVSSIPRAVAWNIANLPDTVRRRKSYA